MKDHFIKYASYVILERAIPHVVDGLKPVQRRILETLRKLHDEKFHKVANVVGQTMQLHPHGDAPINEALVHLANKGFLLDTQGNFGNIYTGDPSAAARYIETRLSPLAKETLFNPDITETIPSYDGRNVEPVTLPAKIPLLLMQGVDGIAVGMATHIFPHNFVELLEAEIAYLEGRSFRIYPDFPTGGIMDKSLYDKGRGKIKLRAKIDIKDPKTLVIRQICYGTTTESLIRSIDEAAKKGKIKIEAINDYTASDVEIEIKLPRGQYAEELLDALYGFTECEITLSSQIVVIKDNYPWEPDVHEILAYNAEMLLIFLKRELEIERDRLLEKIFYRTLERIFIEEKIYKKIETIKSLEGIHTTLEEAFKPYHKKLLRPPTLDDREKLLQIPIRRISRFDIERNQEEIAQLKEALVQVEKHLKNIKRFAIAYLKQLIDRFGAEFPRKTKFKAIEEIDRRSIETKQIRVGFDPETGFVGTKVTGPVKLECTNFDKLLVFYKDGTYAVSNIPEKQYLEQPAWVGIADKKTVMTFVYKNKETQLAWGKRFVVDKFILDKRYTYAEPSQEGLYLTADLHPVVEFQLVTTSRQPLKQQKCPLDQLPIQRPQSRGSRLLPHKVKKIINLKNRGFDSN